MCKRKSSEIETRHKLASSFVVVPSEGAGWEDPDKSGFSKLRL